MEESSSPYKSLKERLEETEEKLMQAAEFGKLLLDENEALKDKIDEVRKECEEKMEVFWLIYESSKCCFSLFQLINIKSML